MIFRKLIIVIVSCTISGCFGYQEPTSYVYLPEYGYLPIIKNRFGTDIMINYVANDWYDAGSGDLHSFGNLGMSPRNSLPQTKDEAAAIVNKNFNFEKALRRPQQVKEIAMLPVALPMIVIGCAPVIGMITGCYGDRVTGKSVKQPPPKTTKIVTKSEEPIAPRSLSKPQLMDQTVLLQVTDTFARPLRDADVVVVSSPTAFTAYADEEGRRTFPNPLRYYFHISTEFAVKLAHFLEMPGAPEGMRTNESGEFKTRVVGDNKSAEIYLLVTKKGYEPNAIRLSTADPSHRVPLLRIQLGQLRDPPDPNRLNPWKIANDLAWQNEFYQDKYKTPRNRPMNREPPLPWSEYEKCVLAAAKFAPDYPVVISARFYYEIENGRLQEAKAFSRFIPDDVYVRAVYGMNWETGLRMR